MAKKPKRPELTRAKVTLSSHPKAPWRVAYDAEVDGKQVRLRRMFASEDRAWLFAEERDREIRNHGLRYGDIPAEVRRAFDFYRDQAAELAAMGAAMPLFEDLVASSIGDIRERLRRAEELHTSVAEAVEAFTRYQKTRVGTRHYNGLKEQLKRFAKDFGDRPISSITPDELENWLGGLEALKNPLKLSPPPLVTPVTRNKYRTRLHSLFGYASAKGRSWCPANPLAGTAYEKEHSAPPKAYSVADSNLLLHAAAVHHPELIPILALGMFAGLRPCEADIFDISALTPKTTEFRVNSSKTGPRSVPFNATCKAWLFSQPRREGPAWIGKTGPKDKTLIALHALAGVERIHDGLRHSYISYRCAKTRDVARVADEAGNSPNTIRKHYRDTVTSAAAEKYFALRPQAVAKNVTSIEQGRVA
jgi:integrase